MNIWNSVTLEHFFVAQWLILCKICPNLFRICLFWNVFRFFINDEKKRTRQTQRMSECRHCEQSRQTVLGGTGVNRARSEAEWTWRSGWYIGGGFAEGGNSRRRGQGGPRAWQRGLFFAVFGHPSSVFGWFLLFVFRLRFLFGSFRFLFFVFLFCSTRLPGGNQVDGLPPAWH